LLLNPDEIGRFLARVDDRNHPAYPGILLTLIPGAQPLPVHRVNYFQSDWFDGFFDPHPDHPPPPTLRERIQRLLALTKPPQLTPPRRRGSVAIYAATAAVAAMAIIVAAWLFSSAGTREDQSAAPEAPAKVTDRPAPVTTAPASPPPATAPEPVDFLAARPHATTSLPAPPPPAAAPEAPVDVIAARPPAAASPIVPGTPLTVSEARVAVINSYLSEACQAAFNTIAHSGTGIVSASIPDNPFEIDNPDGSKKWSFTPAAANVPDYELDLCGSYTQSAPLPAATSPGSAFSIMQKAAFVASRQDVRAFIPGAYGGTLIAPRMPTTPSTDLENMAWSYAEEAGNLPPNARPETAPPTVIQLFRENKLQQGTIDLDVGKIMDRFVKVTRLR
jgi:hypothetical protein